MNDNGCKVCDENKPKCIKCNTNRVLQTTKIETPIINKNEIDPNVSIQTCILQINGYNKINYNGKEISWQPSVEDPKFNMFDTKCPPYTRVT